MTASGWLHQVAARTLAVVEGDSHSSRSVSTSNHEGLGPTPVFHLAQSMGGSSQ